MTRETKAGLVVSCSFLCLVGVVLYCKVNGKDPSLAEAGSEYASVEAPLDPVPIEESTSTDIGHSSPVSPSANSGPTLDSEKLATASSEGKSRSSTSGSESYSLPGANSNEGNTGAVASASSSSKGSNGDSENKSATRSQNVKTASAQSSSTYAIPDAPSDDKDTHSNLTTQNNNQSTRVNQADATLDPLADLKENYKEAKTNSSSKDTNDASTAVISVPEDTGKNKSHNSETARKDNSDIVNSTASVTNTTKDRPDGTPPNSTTGERNPADRKTPHDQEPPPIPAGLHDPFHSLPEATALPENSSESANRSPRDAGLRKPTNPPADSATANGTKAGSKGGITGIIVSPAASTVSSMQGTVPVTTPNLIQAGSSSNSSQSGIRDRDGLTAANAGQKAGLTPGVMPSPRISLTAPAGDTAPEGNVRLGPPTAGLPNNQSEGSASHDPASALPPANQFAQGPAPNLAGQSQGAANPYQNQGPATGSIQPAGYPAAKVDSYDEETYLCKQGDKFEDISTKFYQTDKYAQALLLFNRNHPRASASVRQDPPALAAGQPIYIPPLRVLEKQYATAIPDHVPVNSAGNLNSSNTDAHNPTTSETVVGASMGAGAAAKGSQGSPSSSTPNNRPAPLPVGSPASSDNQTGGQYSLPPDTRQAAGTGSSSSGTNPYSTALESSNQVPTTPMTGTSVPNRALAPAQDRIYQVPKNGETFWEISRKTLGNPNRWPEISRLNPQIKPQYSVPGGTNLKMPPDARIDAPNPMPADKLN